jgi:hypothetical protein
VEEKREQRLVREDIRRDVLEEYVDDRYHTVMPDADVLSWRSLILSLTFWNRALGGITGSLKYIVI